MVTKTNKKPIKKVVSKTTKKTVEYMPKMHNDEVFVRFNGDQLRTALEQLKNSGAQEIGIPVVLRKC